MYADTVKSFVPYPVIAEWRFFTIAYTYDYVVIICARSIIAESARHINDKVISVCIIHDKMVLYILQPDKSRKSKKLDREIGNG